jgi:DNA invertase Pin-like site-specific DNA recombinase
MIFGYARVSTDGQSVDARVKQLRAAGAAHIIKETASGAKTNRAQLRRALKKIDEGDTLLVTRLDRLARSTRDLLNTLAQIADKDAAFRHMGGHHDRARAAYAHRFGRAAEFERDLIRARTGEGRERAKARSVHMGRPSKLAPHQKKEAIRRRDAGEPTRETARMFNVSHSTISRLAV